MSDRDAGFELTVGTGAEARTIAYRSLPGTGPTIVWLGGYRSDMRGTKAEHLLGLAARTGRAFLRLDYSGHGESGGAFEDGTITRWSEEAAAVLAKACGTGPVVLVGSSMGAWIALRLTAMAREGALSSPVAGLLLLAPAPDFTEKLLAPRLTEAQLIALRRDGRIEEPSDYSPEPDVYTQGLIEDGVRAGVMTGPIETGCPVAIIQGMRDDDVPVSHAFELVEHLPAESVTMTLVRDGDHRLSRPQDLALIERLLGHLIDETTAAGA